jgi:hypothetical protein
MYTHADMEVGPTRPSTGRKRLLCGHAGNYSVGGVSEGYEQGIALSFDHDTAVRAERGTQRLLVLLEQYRVGLAQLVKQPG